MERQFWLNHSHLAPRPTLLASKTLPSSLVEHLIRNKSPVAVRNKNGHKITPLQGACHSLVVPLVFPVYISGITNYSNGRHVIDPLPLHEPPFVVVSALVQPDFEFRDVMFSMIMLECQEVVGKALSTNSSNMTDRALKENFVFHFSSSRRLPAAHKLNDDDWASGKYKSYGQRILSLEMLQNIIREQIRIEMIGLDFLAKKFKIKLLYTWDPPSIFAKCIGIETLDHMWFKAITYPGVLSEEIQCIAFNDFSNKAIVPLLRKTLLSQVPVCTKNEIELKAGQVRVLHTNSDAFGEHVKTQPSHSSLDGAIGSSSSAAASLCLRNPKRIIWV